jgi:hypothetical protein
MASQSEAAWVVIRAFPMDDHVQSGTIGYAGGTRE